MKKAHIFLSLTVILLNGGFFSKGLCTELSVDSSPRTVFSAKANKCDPNFIPDSPARAFRRADGQMELIASHYENWMMIGRDFQNLRLSCRSILPVNRYSHNADGHLWIQATYTEDGKRIIGFASQDLTTTMVACGCNASIAPGHCWVNQIMSIRSENMGDDFFPGAIIASFGDKYPPHMTNQFGFFSTSNIVRRGPYYYMLIYLTPGERGKPNGCCLFRTSTPERPMTWRGWDGHDFTYRANQPHSQIDQYCLVTPPEVGSVRSIQYVSKNNEYVATVAARIRLADDPMPVPGFYTMTSPDLIHWSSPVRLIKMPMAARKDDWNDIYAYPSLLDPESQSRNFETIDHQHAALLFSHHHLSHGSGTMNRDLEYVGVTVR